ncbi:hypothetical protein BD309DRAFT_1084857 [Dichomitus squalens]|nr:hypothetical protein BD309DRAFT_1084857 [Dichomitus squalens]
MCSKKRCPFTEEEDGAIKAGYDKHGTVWATIIIFQVHNSQCTNLRDRLRNASPDCYQAVGYKRSNTTKKTYEGSEGKDHRPAQPLRTATDDTSRQAAQQGPGSTKSVPESVNVSEDEDSLDDEDRPAPVSQNSPGGTPHMTGDELVMSPDGETKELKMQSWTHSTTRSPSPTSFLARRSRS